MNVHKLEFWVSITFLEGTLDIIVKMFIGKAGLEIIETLVQTQKAELLSALLKEFSEKGMYRSVAWNIEVLFFIFVISPRINLRVYFK